MRIIFLLLVCLLTVQNIQAQTNPTSKFDSIYYKTAVDIAGSNPDRALVIADSLYQVSEEGLLKLRALMLTANIYQEKNNQVASIRYARQAYDYAIKENYYDWQARISGFLSTQYRNIGLLKEGKEYINKALEVNLKVSSSVSKKMQMALIQQELAYYALLERKYEDVLKHISNSNALLDELSDSPNHLYHKTSAEDLRGRAFLGLKRYQQAEESFLKALDFLNSFDHGKGALSGYIYMGLGEVFVATKDDSLALNYFKLAEIPAKESKHLNLELALYKHFADLYKRNEDWESFQVYSNKLDLLTNQDKSLKRAAIEDVFNLNKKEREKSEMLAKIYLGIGIFIILLSVIFVFSYRNKKNKEYKKFQVLIADIKKEKEQENAEIEPIIRNDSVKNKRVLSLEVEQKILDSLKRFELEAEFLKPTTSLSSLAAFCDTNTKYLSHVLNQNIGKDFNSYVNTLRVNYGIEKLQNDPAFRTYKISYLAEFLGFSSHSKFTAVFKEITDLPPSTFIMYLEKD